METKFIHSDMKVKFASRGMTLKSKHCLHKSKHYRYVAINVSLASYRTVLVGMSQYPQDYRKLVFNVI